MAQLPDTLRLAEVLQPMRAEIPHRGTVGQAIGDEIAGRGGEQGLPAVRDPSKPGAADDGASHVAALVPKLGLAGVQGHPDPQPGIFGPRLLGEGPLHIQRGGHGIRRAGGSAPTTLSPSPCSTGRTPSWSAIAVPSSS